MKTGRQVMNEWIKEAIDNKYRTCDPKCDRRSQVMGAVGSWIVKGQDYTNKLIAEQGLRMDDNDFGRFDRLLTAGREACPRIDVTRSQLIRVAMARGLAVLESRE